MEVEADNDIRRLTTPRTKEFGQIHNMHFRVKVIELGRDPAGDPITSVVVDWSPIEFEAVCGLNPNQSAALDALESALMQNGNPPNGVRNNVWRSTFNLVHDKEGSQASVKAKFNRLVRDLVQSGHARKTQKGQYVRTDLVR